MSEFHGIFTWKGVDMTSYKCIYGGCELVVPVGGMDIGTPCEVSQCYLRKTLTIRSGTETTIVPYAIVIPTPGDSRHDSITGHRRYEDQESVCGESIGDNC